jgi:Zinc knuckle
MARPSIRSSKGVHFDGQEVDNTAEREETPVEAMPGAEDTGEEAEEIEALTPAAPKKNVGPRQSLVIGDITSAPEFIGMIRGTQIDEILKWDRATMLKAVTQAANTVEDWEAEIDEMRETIREQAAAMKSIRLENSSLLSKVEVLKSLIQEGVGAGASEETPRGKRTTKLSHPWYFDGSELAKKTFDVWMSKMRGKLRGNKDHYPTEEDRMIYVESRVTGDAHGYFAPRLRKGAKNPFQTAEEMLKVLQQAYGDLNPKATAREKLQKLYQREDTFIKFWGEFLQIQAELEADEDTQIDEIRRRVSPELMAAIAGLRPTTAHELAQECIYIDQNLQKATQARQRMNRFNSNKENSTDRKKTGNRGRVSASTPGLAGPPEFSAPAGTTPPTRPKETQEEYALRQKRFAERSCFKCGESGHIAKYCTKGATGVSEVGPAKAQATAELDPSSDSEN